jgi:hypothetical protein
MIVGLPDLLRHFHKLFIEMIEIAVRECVEEEGGAVSAIVAGKDDLIHPWSYDNDTIAPEDLETELPSSFSTALHFMELSYDEAVAEFLSLIPKHVSKEFLENSNVEHLLKTKGIKVFLPQNWDGINGVEPLKLSWKPGLPESMKPRARPINPRLYENAKKEFQRLLKYFYVPSTSPLASCLVIAPKATTPFIRFCGDYVAINKYINIGHYPIPNVQYNLEKLAKYSLFMDIDLQNAFHQVRLHPETSERLSVQTPWGQVQPLFMPEGIGPASGVLQKVVSEIFAPFEEWTVVIFDNILVLAHDYKDGYEKLEKILDRCIERNVYLKFSKTWLGFDHANFFGYVCRKGSYELSQERKEALKAIPFPRNTKAMQSFLGVALFFKSFIPNYSSLAAPLNDMVKKTFNWDESTWTVDYRKIFDEFKEHLQNSCAIYYPNYELDFVLRCDASLWGVGAGLFQVYKPTSDPATWVYQPIGFASKKFSPQAMRWTTIEQEAYGCYFAVWYFRYYLQGKLFILETDHNNLLWMEASAVPKVIRWRIYLQSFNFLLRHIPGKQNQVADWLSRAFEEPTLPPIEKNQLALVQNCLPEFEQMLDDKFERMKEKLFDNALEAASVPAEIDAPIEVETVPLEVDEPKPVVIVDEDVQEKIKNVLRQVHGGRMGHHGARETWKLLNKHFPGHRIPYRYVSDFVATCPICQKDRLGMVDNLQPIVRHLKPLHRRAMVGVDTLTVTPTDKDGNCLLLVVVNHTTKFTALYPAANHDAVTTATALFQFCCSYGLFDSLISDPGSEFANEVIQHLTQWFGIRHVFSLVDRHESNGVEGTNKLILRHLKALVMDERVQDRWSSPTILPLVQFILNSRDCSETGVVPFHATFGSADAIYFRMPEGEEGDGMRRVHAYIKLLDENLKLLTEISKKFQEQLIAERTAKTPIAEQNEYQPGDLVLWQLNPDDPLPTKLTPKFLGPYEVLSQEKNDVTCKHIVLGQVKVFHVTRLKMFHGSYDEAYRLAMLDNDQYSIRRFVSYRGNPTLRTTMEFEIEFEDGSCVWLPWSKDIFDTVQYEEYCRSRPELLFLLHDVKTAAQLRKELNNTPITEVQPGDTVYVDLRCYGATWYASLPIPDPFHTTYLLEYKYISWVGKRKLKLKAGCKVFDETFVVDHEFVRSYGSNKILPNDPKTKLIDKDFIEEYPMLLTSK